jgi:ABC-2 type transport system ATP-binding protein
MTASLPNPFESPAEEPEDSVVDDGGDKPRALPSPRPPRADPRAPRAVAPSEKPAPRAPRAKGATGRTTGASTTGKPKTNSRKPAAPRAPRQPRTNVPNLPGPPPPLPTPVIPPSELVIPPRPPLPPVPPLPADLRPADFRPADIRPADIRPSAPQPEVDAEPEAAASPVTAPEPDEVVQSEPVVDPEPLIESEPVVEPEPLVESEPVAEPELVVEPEPVAEAEPSASTALEITVEEPEPEPEPEPQPIIEPEPQILVEPREQSEAETDVPALSLRGVTKTFGETRAVDAIDLTVPTGSFYGLVGPNGAGKTTTLSMIAGLLRPDAGAISIGGIDASRKGAATKRLMGVLPDRLRTFDRLTGRQLLYYYGVLRGLPSAVVETRMADLARAFDLVGALGRPVSDYSAGMTKKVMLAGAMIHSPRLLVLDEPFEAVDPVSSAVILDILSTYVAHGGTVILSSHGMELVERVCSRVAVIVAGQVLAEGTVDEVRGESTLEQRFLELAGGLGDLEGLEWLHTFSD